MPELDDAAISVTLPPDETGGAIVKVLSEDEGKKPDTPVDDPIADLKGQFDTLKNSHQTVVQRLSTTEQELAKKDRELTTVRGQVADSQLDTVLTGLAAAEAEATAAEKEYVTAAEAGDFAAQARAQRKISAAETRIARLKEAEGDLKDAKTQQTTQRAETSQQARQPAADPVEQAASQMAPRAAAWIRAHPECITDPAKNAKMLAAHWQAKADGLDEGSDAYFAKIEAGVEGRVTKRPSAPTAPVSHAGGGMNGGGNTVTLTKREADAATDGSLVYNYDDPNGKFKKNDPIGVQEMARRKMIMMRQGLYDKSYDQQ